MTTNYEDANWPYDDVEALAPPRSVPSWDCPGGTCHCDRLAEQLEAFEHEIVLFDENAERMPHARCRVMHAGRLLNEDAAYANGDGVMTVELPPHAKWLEVHWAPRNCPCEPPYPFRRLYHVHMGDTFVQGVTRRLDNLGFSLGSSLGANVTDFLRTFGLPETELTRDFESALFNFHDEAGLVRPPPVEPPTGPQLSLGVPAAWPPSELPGRGTPPSTESVTDASFLPRGEEGDKNDNGALLLGSLAPTLGGSSAVQPFDPFLVASPPIYTPSHELGSLFSDFGTTFPHVALSIVELHGISRPYFGFRDTEEFFSASTCKLTALMTATMLLNSLRWFAWALFWDGIPVDQSQFLDEAAAAFRAKILEVARAHPELGKSVEDELLPVLAGRSGHPRLTNLAPAFVASATPGPPPGWPPILAWVDGPIQVSFSHAMTDNIRAMMGLSDNEASAYIIRTTGLGYIHGALEHAGLFANDHGLWLTGDFSDKRGPSKYTRRDIPCVNDRPTAQGATSIAFLQAVDMGLAGVFGEPLFVKAELERSRVQNPSWMGRASGFANYGFDDIMGKIGDSFALAGTVFSEVMGVRHRASNRRFLICFQNAKGSEATNGPLTNYIFPRLITFIQATEIIF